MNNTNNNLNSHSCNLTNNQNDNLNKLNSNLNNLNLQKSTCDNGTHQTNRQPQNIELVLDQEEVYDPAQQTVWCFKHVDDIVEGQLLNLGNMTSCYPFEFEGQRWRSSEELYLSGEFSSPSEEHLQVQKELRSAKSPYAAKRFIKAKHRKKVREDFQEFRTQWMLLVVWIKCLVNNEFRQKLLSIPVDITLIEETTTDTGGTASIWGCANPELVKARKEIETSIKEKHSDLKKADLKHLINVETNAVRNVGLFKGQNNIGKILMICRRCLLNGSSPRIDIDLLRSKEIYILGKKLDFNHEFISQYRL